MQAMNHTSSQDWLSVVFSANSAAFLCELCGQSLSIYRTDQEPLTAKYAEKPRRVR
jgi:hypothetical protein